jgi:hypothetical protein
LYIQFWIRVIFLYQFGINFWWVILRVKTMTRRGSWSGAGQLASLTLSWLRANQSFLLLFNDVCLTEKQQIPILVFGLCSNSWDTALDKHANNYTTNAVIQYLKGEMKTKSKAKAVYYNIWVNNSEILMIFTLKRNTKFSIFCLMICTCVLGWKKQKISIGKRTNFW